jgi:plasmid maintenance system antidote protein VapI
MDNINLKKERVNAAFNFLREHGYLHTQKDMAEAIGSTPPNISRMLAGDPKVLTDNICVRIQRAYPIISANWLIHGDGDMLIMNNNTERQMMMPDPSSVANAIIASKDETIAEKDARIEAIKDTIAEKDARLADKDAMILNLQGQLRDKDATIADREATIVDLREQLADHREQLADLRRQLSAYQSKDMLEKYPFQMGAADEGDRPSAGR